LICTEPFFLDRLTVDGLVSVIHKINMIFNYDVRFTTVLMHFGPNVETGGGNPSWLLSTRFQPNCHSAEVTINTISEK